MNYEQVCQYLDNCCMFGSKRGHDRLKELLKLLGSPQKKLSFIHVAGTNGKGSCCAFLSSVLMQQGYNVGVFTSPHLIKYNERYNFNGEDISDDEFCSIIEIESQDVDKLCGDFFSFFDIIAAAAFCWFFEKKADFVILETGLGGRLDPTNVIESPILSVITSISLDHTDILGDTIEKISVEKAGIIKKNCPAVLYCGNEKVYNIINEICKKNNSKLFYTKNYKESIIVENFDSVVFNAEILDKHFDGIKIKMLGDYQIKNACGALLCIEALRSSGIIISDKAVYGGFEKAFISGRMELVKKDKPYIILDGAHNIDGCMELCRYIRKIKEKNNLKTVLLVGILKTKSFSKMINRLSSVADSLVLTKPEGKKGLDAHELYECLEQKDKCIYCDNDFKKAFKAAVEAENTGLLVCCGSLYLVGALKKYLKEESFYD